MKVPIKQFIIKYNTPLKQALKRFDSTKEGILFLVDKNFELVGSITNGDIRRWVLNDGNSNKSVFDICNKKPFFVKENFNYTSVKNIMIKKRLSSFPVVTKDMKIINILFWHDIIGDKKQSLKKKINSSVVIMAGGFGKRLDPFTRVLPKPLIPIGEKTIVEIIIDNFREYKINTFYLSVNYKSKIIKSYFEELNPKYKVIYINEDKPLGTAGSLKFIDGKIKNTFFLINCDTVIEEDYASIFEFHKKNHFDITVVSSMKNYVVSYGICILNKDGSLKKIKEKPEYNILANTGMYVVEPKCLKLIPKNSYFDFPVLIKKIIERGGKVGVFPIKAEAWLDVGVWDEYKKTTEILGKLMQ